MLDLDTPQAELTALLSGVDPGTCWGDELLTSRLDRCWFCSGHLPGVMKLFLELSNSWRSLI